MLEPLRFARALLPVFSALVFSACGSPETSSTENDAQLRTETAPGFRSELGTHKVQLTAAQRDALGAPGRLISDYGAFAIYEVDGDAAKRLPPEVTFRGDDNDVHLNTGVIDTASKMGRSLGNAKRSVARGKTLRLIQFSAPPRNEWHDALLAAGVKVVSYIPANAYLIYGDAAALEKAMQGEVQWTSEYADDFKVDPSVYTTDASVFTFQLVEDEAPNRETLARIRNLHDDAEVMRSVQGYVNIEAKLTREQALQLATRPDLISIHPKPTYRKADERSSMLLAGQITGSGPTAPGYLSWLASKGFTQSQFDASDFGVDVADSGIDNGTTTPNHFALYQGGSTNNASRVVYSRLEGTPSSGSTLQGCDGHGTLNAHLLAGYSDKTGAIHQDAQGYAYGLGVAPFVKLGSSVVFDPDTFTNPNLANLQARAYRDGMRISTNGWSASNNTYSADSQLMDGIVRDAQASTSAVPSAGNQQMVVLFASGNAGSAAGTVGQPSTAKNVITVGGAESVRAFGGADQCAIADNEANNWNDVATFSSRGPTSDGRKKPDLMAPSTHVTGGLAQSNGQRAEPPASLAGQALGCFDGSGVCGGTGSSTYFPANQQWYTASSGTSHAVPQVAGGAALLRQFFINQSMNPPSPAMTKAYLMNTARYMTGVGANDTLFSNAQGMGLMDLDRAFDFVPRLLRDQDASDLFTATGQTRTFTGYIAASDKPTRITLAWTDAPGSTTGAAWKNNLDLTVTSGANTYKGNVFTGALSTTGGVADNQNNVESVYLPSGTSGQFTVTVTATNINSDGVPNNASALDQDFALVAYNSCSSSTPAPTDTGAVVAGDNRVIVYWTENGSASYNIFRSKTPGGPYTKVGTAVTSPFADTSVSGGVTYHYVVRGVQCAESVNSNEASVTATGACNDPPTFSGLATASATSSGTCAVNLSWSAASGQCSGIVNYEVYRSRTDGFTPSAANRVATGVSGTSYQDNANLQAGVGYYYLVRAVEQSASNTLDDGNTVRRNAAASGCTTFSPPGGPAEGYAANPPPSTVAAGVSTRVTVRAVDAAEGTATSYSGAANITVSDNAATAPTTVAFAGGEANVDIVFRTLGSQSVTLTDAGAPSLTASVSTTVVVGPPAQLELVVQPSVATSSAPLTPAIQVALRNALGNPTRAPPR